MRDRLNRLLSLKKVLQQSSASCAQLAAAHRVSDRTIYRDLKYLRQLGAVIVLSRDGYRWESRGLDLDFGCETRQLLRRAAALLQRTHPDVARQLLTLSVSG